MPVDQGFQAINHQRHLLVAAVDREIRALLAGRGLPFVILVGDEKMEEVAVSTNCTELGMCKPMVVRVAEWFRSGVQVASGEEVLLLTDKGRRRP